MILHLCRLPDNFDPLSLPTYLLRGTRVPGRKRRNVTGVFAASDPVNIVLFRSRRQVNYARRGKSFRRRSIRELLARLFLFFFRCTRAQFPAHVIAEEYLVLILIGLRAQLKATATWGEFFRERPLDYSTS